MRKPDEAHQLTDKELSVLEKRIATRRKKFVFNFCGHTERLLELDQLYLKIQMVSGYTAEQLLEMFMEGYTMQPLPKPVPVPLEQICDEKT